MITLLLLSGCLINQALYDQRRAELTAAEDDTDDTDGDTDCTPLTVWVDADGDGWGTSLYPDARCGDLTGWATREGDCDDGDSAPARGG